ncbi:hypothetical protein [Sphingobacterium gobiense]|uniref:Uncharacterized protein n=1 Tax=Sphingobacterium gobiense TaxID=1382456 RepID=A0A2S9JL32_9SPHI|nr:hypothetical protein [Sphingobacterium gobiense]PRD53699.1 hypothetical protein C5749_09210 [Sphingobacterium gobiense]
MLNIADVWLAALVLSPSGPGAGVFKNYTPDFQCFGMFPTKKGFPSLRDRVRIPTFAPLREGGMRSLGTREQDGDGNKKNIFFLF